MNISHWNPTYEDVKNFITYGFIEHPMGFDVVLNFYKKPFPEYCNVPSENPETIKKAKEYFKKSNEEDIFVLEKEKEAFDKFYNETKKDIIRHKNLLNNLI